jgi:hypothetical protein
VVRALEAEMDATAASIPALRRFHTLLETLPADVVHTCLAPVWAELCFNLESFNPVFTAVMLKVQCTLGASDYVRRDEALQCLIQPRRANEGNPPSAHLVEFKALDIRQRIGIAVMRACADSVITQFAKSPHAALTSKKRFNTFAVAPPPPRLEDASAF